MTSQLIRSESQIVPDGTASYSVWVWSTVPSRHVTATVYIAGQAMRAPTFALCPSPKRSTCSIGSLPAYQSIEILVSDHIGKKATAGEQITMTVAVQGSAQGKAGGPLSPAEAGVSTVLNQASPSPSSPGTGTSVPSGSIPGLPGTTVTPPGNYSSLFPEVTPSSTPPGKGSSKHKAARLTAATSSLPLDTRLIGGQLAGLAVLAAAITMVVARLSLRTPQTALPSGDTAPPQTPAPEVPTPQNPEPQSEAAASETPERQKPTDS